MKPSPLFAVILLSCGVAVAQIHTGGKGGGLPGGGPGPTTGPGSTGGRTLPTEPLLRHVLERVTFGATDDDIALVRAIGVDAFLELQLHPETIAESPTLGAKLAGDPPRVNALGEPQGDAQFLLEEFFLRARYSRRQLLEIMTEFWQNHFSNDGGQLTSNSLGPAVALAYDSAGTAFIAAQSRYTSAMAFHRAIAIVGWDGRLTSYSSLTGGSGHIGLAVSIAIDPTNGDRLTAYYEDTAGGLKYLRSGSSGFAATVDKTPDVGRWNSIAVDAGGKIYVAYYDRTNGDLKFASSNATGFDLETVDAAGDVGMHASLALDGTGQPAIAYYDQTNRDLRYATRAGGVWRLTNIDTAGDVGAWCSLAIEPIGNLHAISYSDRTNGDVKLARFDGSTWQTERVAAGDFSSLALDPFSGEPAIAYRSLPDFDLTYAQRAGATYNFTVVTPGVEVTGDSPSLAFSPVTRLPHIAHRNSSRREVWLASFDGSSWSAASLIRSDIRRALWEAVEFDGFRTHALGRFRDLLAVSAHSPGMMKYLSNDTNVAGSGNENYARELLELHTLGVDGGYSQNDVEEVARAFTGWTTTESRLPSSCERLISDFCYNHDGHDGRPRRVLDVDLPDDSAATPTNYMRQGEAILDILARHPATASFLCTKLIHKFVRDDPDEETIARCSSVFRKTDGDIRQVLTHIFRSAEFRSPSSFLVKVRTPLELVAATLRHLDGDSDGSWVFAEMAAMKLSPFAVLSPTGYDETGLSWISPASMIERWRFADRITHNLVNGSTVDPYALALASGVTTADGLVQLFVSKLLNGEASIRERGHYVDTLSGGNPLTFDLTNSATPGRMRDMVGLMLGAPGSWKQ